MNLKPHFLFNNPVLVSLTLGIILILASYLVKNHSEKSLPGLHPLAQIEVNLPQAYFYKHSSSQKSIIKKKMTMGYLDSIETDSDGLISLEFEKGEKIRLSESGFLTLDQEAEKIIIILKRGELEVENIPQHSNVYISFQGQRMSLSQFQHRNTNQQNISLNNSATTQKDGKKISSPGAQLPPLTIEQVQNHLKQSKNNFFKCYSQLLQKNPGISGQSTLAFTIERNGKVGAPEITTSTLSDPQFKKCLVEAVSRVEFPPFEGDPITTTYPLRFE